MNKQIEALKMSIEALEGIDECYWEHTVLQTCKEALAEAEKQEWQSLSDDDISEILNKHGFDNVEMAGCHIDIVLLIRDTEQALKEKNHA